MAGTSLIGRGQSRFVGEKYMQKGLCVGLLSRRISAKLVVVVSVVVIVHVSTGAVGSLVDSYYWGAQWRVQSRSVSNNAGARLLYLRKEHGFRSINKQVPHILVTT